MHNGIFFFNEKIENNNNYNTKKNYESINVKSDSLTFFEKLNEKVNKMLKMYKSTWLFYYNKIKLILIPFIKIETLVPNEGFIIDLGCSHGLFANMMALNSEKREVLGLDINEKRIEHANIGIKNASFKAGDITKIEIPKADCIILTHVIHHIPLYEDQIKLLRTCHDKLKAGGKIIIVELCGQG